jgi:hypothetical protein
MTNLEVVTSYDAGSWPAYDTAVHHAVGRTSDFSGIGFGRRDLGWVCKSEFEAKGIERKLKALGLTPTIREGVGEP